MASDQSELDLKREEAVAEGCRVYWGFDRMVKICEGSRTDHFGTKDELGADGRKHGWVKASFEIKARHGAGPSKYKDGAYFALRKWESLILVAAAFEVPGYFVVAFEDFLGYVSLETVKGIPLELKGRFDRGYNNDVEPMIVVPWELFERFKPVKKGGRG